MGRRRNSDPDWILLVPGLAGAVMLLCMISPQARDVILAMGFLAMCILGLGAVGLIGFVIYRRAARTDNPAFYEATPQTPLTVFPSQQNVTIPYAAHQN